MFFIVTFSKAYQKIFIVCEIFLYLTKRKQIMISHLFMIIYNIYCYFNKQKK